MIQNTVKIKIKLLKFYKIVKISWDLQKNDYHEYHNKDNRILNV